MAKVPQRWANNKEVAAHVGVSPMTIWRWRQDPNLNFPAPAIVNNRPRTDLDSVDDWLCARLGAEMDNSDIAQARRAKFR